LKKNYEYADYVFYLPMDGKENARKFIALIQPQFAVFVKYEFWYFYLQQLYQKNIPAILMAAAFRDAQPFFKWYGGLFRRMLSFYDFIFVQDENSQMLLQQIGVQQNVAVGGDTRYDRVAVIAQQAQSFPLIEKWKGDYKILIAGSTWQEDERVLKNSLDSLPEDWKMIIAPHEIHEERIKEIEAVFADETIRYSALTDSAKRILILDNYGMLSSAYRCGTIAFVGGGFVKDGIHNILEAAVYGLPVFFGPYYKKFVEAAEMVQQNLAFPVKDAAALQLQLKKIINDAHYRASLQKEILHFMKTKEGATLQIMTYLKRFIKT
jgi:3-deoxy-D-manno-octulosonic-acid transferase